MSSLLKITDSASKERLGIKGGSSLVLIHLPTLLKTLSFIYVNNFNMDPPSKSYPLFLRRFHTDLWKLLHSPKLN